MIHVLQQPPHDSFCRAGVNLTVSGPPNIKYFDLTHKLEFESDNLMFRVYINIVIVICGITLMESASA